MGLDMYAMAIKADTAQTDVDIHDLLGITPEHTEAERDAIRNRAQANGTFVYELHYWRKCYVLHGWLQRLYKAKGGKDPEFNGTTLRLTAQDLANLEHALIIPPDEDPEDYDLDYLEDMKAFIAKARALMTEGFSILYLPSH